MIVCKFINSRPDWAPSSLVYLIGFNSFNVDELEVGMAYKVFAPLNEKCELVDTSIVGNVILKRIAGDLLGVEDESDKMWNMVKIVTTDKIAVDCKKSGEKEISFIPSGQTVKENETTADEPSTNNDHASKTAAITEAFLKSLGYKLVPMDDESKGNDLATKEFLDLIAHKYKSDKAYEDFCRRFNYDPNETDDSDEIDESDESDESADESDLLTKVSDDETSSVEPTDTSKLTKWQVDVLNKMRTLVNANRAQWGRPPLVMPDYTQMDQNDFDDEFDILAFDMSKSHPAGFYGATGYGPNGVIRGPHPIATKPLIESVSAVNQKSESNPWNTTHKVEIRFDRMVTFPEVIQFLTDHTEWNPGSSDFQSLKVFGRTCKFLIHTKTSHPLITRIAVASYHAPGVRLVGDESMADSDGHSSSDDEDDDD